MRTSILQKTLFCCVALFFSLQAKLQIITTVAGNGTSNGYNGGDSGLALNAGIYPQNIDFDSHGNMFITDGNHSVIRKVNVSTGIITTIAGNGTAGFSGDNGPAVLAQLNYPYDAIVDSSGNIYIADADNYRIRKIDVATGIITTIAGNGTYGYSGDAGLAINAGLSGPVAVAVDASNSNLYIADGGRIRKVNFATGIITTIAGTNVESYNGDGILAINANLLNPFALAIDTVDNIYIAEFGRVRKINASDGIIHTIAGNGSIGYNGDGGLATNAEIAWSWGLALDKKNNIYISDWLFYNVRKVNLTDSIITTVAGTGHSGYNGDGILATEANVTPYGIATDFKGNFYFADTCRVRKVTIDSSALNEIFGYSYYDLNSNSIKDSVEPFFSAGKIVSKKNTDSIVTITSGGNFRIGVDTGTYNSSFVPFKNYYNTVPPNHTSSSSAYNNIDTVYFALQPITGKEDINISMYSWLPPRAGFDVPYTVFYKNVGTDTISNGVIQLVKDPGLNFVSASPVYSSINGDTIRWNYTNLKPLDTASIFVDLNTSASLNIGDTLHSTATINPVENDLFPADNTSTLNQLVVASYDPNNKSENHAGSITKTAIENGDYLTYTIRFQNTGTYAAFNIVVKDTLSNKLDWNSFEMVDASSNYQLNISDGNKCSWYFNAIGLPDSNSNEPASHGYIVYRIKPKNSLVGGDIINNTAGIYFDYNLPVETNNEKTIVTNNILPLQLLSFTAEHNGKANLLKWSSANEINTNRFEIQRSGNSYDFTSIGFVNALNNSKIKNDYTYTDAQPLKAINYYRLKMIDNDGKYTYSIIRSLNNSNSFDVTLYPNPVRNDLALNFSSEKLMEIEVEIISTEGKIAFFKKIQIAQGESKQIINTEFLTAGNYFVRCISSEGETGLRFVKQ